MTYVRHKPNLIYYMYLCIYRPGVDPSRVCIYVCVYNLCTYIPTRSGCVRSVPSSVNARTRTRLGRTDFGPDPFRRSGKLGIDLNGETITASVSNTDTGYASEMISTTVAHTMLYQQRYHGKS